MPDIKVLAAVLCEFCRPELNNKYTLIGVFSGDIQVENFPAAFPVSAYVELSGVPVGHHRLSIEMGVSGTEFRFDADMEAAGPLGAFPFPQAMVNVAGPGPIFIRLKFDDGEWIEALSRNLIQGPVISA